MGSVEVTGEKPSSGALPANQRDSQQQMGSKALTLARLLSGLGNELLSVLCQGAREHVYQPDHHVKMEEADSRASVTQPVCPLGKEGSYGEDRS